MRIISPLLIAAVLALNISAEGPRLKVGADERGLELRVQLPGPAVVDMEARTEVEASDDLQTWRPLASYTNVQNAASSVRLQGDAGRLFFRARQLQQLAPSKEPGAEIFGYKAEFVQNLQQLGFIAPGELTNFFEVPDYLPALTWDPTTADFWQEFQLDTTAHNSALRMDSPDRRVGDFRLNEAELAMFKRNGFVASRRLSTWSFGESFYRVFMDDLPIYVSSDAILQAWHQVFKLTLQEWEAHYIHPELDRLLEATANALKPILLQHAGGHFEASVRDADVFLAVARSLLKGQPVPTQSGQDAEVARILEGIASEQYLESFELFGLARPTDFSQFKPRGNYEDRPGYFRATMWLGRMDMRVADPQPGSTQSGSLRELARAIALHEALVQSGEQRAWEGINTILDALIGYADSMNFLQLAALLNAGGLPTLQDIGTEANLVRLQDSILNGSLGYQQIRGDVFFTPLDGSQRKLPRSFAFSGQRFIFDSWALSQVVHDGILWPDGNGKLSKVKRLMPDTLDVAFAVLGNNAAAPMIVGRIQTGSTNTWRDGHPYQHNLAALRMVVDAQRSGVWNQQFGLQRVAGRVARAQPTNHRPGTRRGLPHPRVGEQAIAVPAGGMDPAPARHNALRQAKLHRADSLLVSAWLRRAVAGILGPHAFAQ